jgi:hypothetical protein
VVLPILWDETAQKSGRQWNKKLYSSLPFITLQVKECTACPKNIVKTYALIHINLKENIIPRKSAANVPEGTLVSDTTSIQIRRLFRKI